MSTMDWRDGLEPAPAWRKSSLSGAGGCVEVAGLGDVVLMRHTKDPAGPVLVIAGHEWDAFLDRVRAGELDRDRLVVGP